MNDRTAISEAELRARQIELADLEIDQIKRENRWRHWSLRVRHVNDVMKLTFQFATALIVLALLGGIGAILWSASSDHGLVIEPFAVPPELGARGYTGDVVAAGVLDSLNGIDRVTESQRAANTYRNYWANDIKVQIPDTGVSIGEINRFLHGWLGHQTVISGAIVRDGGKLSAMVRVSGGPSRTVPLDEAALGASLKPVAEAIYGATQLYRYGIYLRTVHRNDEAASVFLAGSHGAPGDPDTAWNLMGYANWVHDAVSIRRAEQVTLKALAVSPHHFIARQNLCQMEDELGDSESALRNCRLSLADLQRNDYGLTGEHYHAVNIQRTQGYVDAVLGSFDTELSEFDFVRARGGTASLTSMEARRVQGALGTHDIARAERDAAAPSGQTYFSTRAAIDDIWAQTLLEVARERWDNAIAKSARADAVLAKWPGLRDMMFVHRTVPVGYALARKGDIAAARAMIAPSPGDCYPCLVVRGQIETLAHNWPEATKWFAAAERSAPSPPFASFEWGRMLLARGDTAGAIAKFAEANRKGPHFADPLELWGEALMLQNRSDLALAKFEKAARYAPNWGRLYLKWAEALHYAGRRDEAEKQFTIARSLFLVPSERTELSRVSHG